MKVDNTKDSNTVIHLSNDRTSRREQKASHTDKNNRHNSSIYAGDINLQEDKIGSKYRLAARKALKALMDPFNNDNNLDQKVSDLKEKQRKLLDEADLAAAQVKDLKSKKVELKASYGIDNNSQEQKNLELLEKSIYSPEKMTEEDRKNLQNIGPLTDYQKDALKYDTMQKIYQARINKSTGSIMNLNHAITSIALERLKTHPMVDAQGEAAKIIEAASKEVIATLLDEGKDHIDKTIEENKKETEKKQEEKEKKDEVAEKTDDVTGRPAVSENDNSGPTISEQTRQIHNADELKRAAVKQNLIEDELKGIVVDETV